MCLYGDNISAIFFCLFHFCDFCYKFLLNNEFSFADLIKFWYSYTKMRGVSAPLVFFCYVIESDEIWFKKNSWYGLKCFWKYAQNFSPSIKLRAGSDYIYRDYYIYSKDSCRTFACLGHLCEVIRLEGYGFYCREVKFNFLLKVVIWFMRKKRGRTTYYINILLTNPKYFI